MVGYAHVRNETRELVERCRTGQGGVLVVHGEAGSGKSTLLAEVRAESALPRLEVTGAEAESALPHAGLLGVLRPVLSHLDACSPRSRVVLLAALGRADGEPPGPFAVPAATLELLAEVAATTPHLLVIDDAHWVDHESLTALLFSLRRLRDQPLLTLVGVRTGTAAHRLMADLPGLELTGLAVPDAALLLRRAASGWAMPVVTSLVAYTGGNPLALLELARESTPAQRQGRDAWVHDVPAATELEHLFTRELEDLPAAAGLAALAAALGGSADGRLLTEVLAGLGSSRRALAAAIEAGALRPDNGGVSFRHPLMRSAAVNRATESERRDVHRAFASAFARRHDADQETWHLGQAADSPDAALAARLIETAERAVAAGDRSTAARVFRRAAELQPEPGPAALTLARAGSNAIVAGLAEGSQWLARADESLTDPVAAGTVLILRARWSAWNGDVAHLISLTDRLDERHAPAVRSELHAMVALTGLTGFDADRLRDHVAALLQQHSSVAGPLTLHCRIAVSMGSLVGAPRAWAESFPDASDLSQPDLDLGAPLALSALMLGRLDLADSVLAVTSTLIRQQTAVPALAWSEVSAAYAHLSAGRLAAAQTSAQQAIEISQAVGADFALAFAHGMAALVAGTLGRRAEWQQHAEAVRARGAHLELSFVQGLIDLGRGRLLVPAGQHEEAIRVLSGLTARLRDGGMPTAALMPALPELIEALVRGGRRTEGAALLPGLEHESDRLRLPHLDVYTRRARAAVAPDGALDETYAPALRTDSRWPDPLGLARARLLLGERLRRMRRVKDSRDQLARAHEAFSALGVEPWEQLARRESAAAGLRTTPRPLGRTADDLTPREAEIAHLIRSGLSNREIAAVLVVSPKTVESQLTTIYRKAGVNGRRGLMSGEDTSADRGSGVPTPRRSPLRRQ